MSLDDKANSSKFGCFCVIVVSLGEFQKYTHYTIQRCYLMLWFDNDLILKYKMKIYLGRRINAAIYGTSCEHLKQQKKAIE